MQLQRGSALLVSMIMIFMLSLMGISAMRTSTMEKRMAINAIQSSTTFQAAESASDLAINNTDNLMIAYNAGVNQRVILDIDEVNSNIGLESRSTLMYAGSRAVEGFSLGEGGNTFQSLSFMAQGISSIEAVRSQSNVEQGAFRIIPAN